MTKRNLLFLPKYIHNIFAVPSEPELACGNPVGFVPLTPPSGGPTPFATPSPSAPLKLEAQISSRKEGA